MTAFVLLAGVAAVAVAGGVAVVRDARRADEREAAAHADRVRALIARHRDTDEEVL